MPIVSSFGTLQHFERSAAPFTTGLPVGRTLTLTLNHGATYAAMYRTQPEVRTCVDFLARNLAQIGIHLYRRVSDTDRVRVTEHQLAEWLEHPNPDTGGYRLIESMMADLGVYFMAFWMKVRRADDTVIGLVRLPPETVEPYGWLMPEGFIWTRPDGSSVPVAPRDMVYFRGYNPDNPLLGLSLLETLRQSLYEEAAAKDYRSAFWQNSARLDGVIERPIAAGRWGQEQVDQFKAQWQERYVGSPGGTPVLQEGMTYKGPLSATASDSEYVASRKLTREEVASAFQIPHPMVGLLDHATYSNITEQHKIVYQDTLGPWTKFVVQEIMRQLLPDCRDPDVYLEFNIAEKLKGAFEEQGAAMHSLVGRPIMTPNEGRARLNLPSIKDDPTADQLAMPMNMGTEETTGQEATAPAVAPPRRLPAAEAIVPVITAAWTRQRSRLAKLPDDQRTTAFAGGRLDRELTEDLLPLYRAIGLPFAEAHRASTDLAERINTDTVARLGSGLEPFPPSREAHAYVD
jgi:HK97 family phage portal protein